MEKLYWGLDIGGTKCALVTGTRDCRVLSRHAVPTRDFSSWQEVLEALLAHAPQEAPAAVGVSCGGPLDSRRGRILSPPNLPGWDDVPIVDWLKARVGAPAFLQNDANACALAEWRFGAGKGCENMIFLTFGTGFGAGLILDGRLYTGTNDMAGEVGHVRAEKDGPEGYGKRGSFEGFCSGAGIAKMAGGVSAREVVERADAGDEAMLAVLRESACAVAEDAAPGVQSAVPVGAGGARIQWNFLHPDAVFAPEIGGQGMPKQHDSRLFSGFFRAADRRKNLYCVRNSLTSSPF